MYSHGRGFAAGGLLLALMGIANTAIAQANIDALNKATQNPVANLISVPFQENISFNAGPNKETQSILNIQPVIPFKLSDHWNLITRTIIPVISQPVLAPGIGSATGLGDINFTGFLSPISDSPFIWGVGPSFLIPAATDKFLGSGKWAAGPSGVGLIQKGRITSGLLFNHLWSFAGDFNRTAVNQVLIQPFFSYSFQHGWSLSLLSETTYDKKASVNNQWTVPIDLTVGKILVLGKQPLSIGGGVRYFPVKPDFQATWGIRIAASLLFPT